MNVEINYLKYFYYTVTEGGVTRAAEKLCIQQPVVSKMIKTLEEQLQKDLFITVGREKKLTDFGQLVYRHARNIFEELEKINDMQKTTAEISGNWSIGSAEVIAIHLLPNFIKYVRSEFPNIHPNIYSSTSSELIAMISQRQLDVGLFFHVPDLPKNLDIIKKIPCRFHLVVNSSEKLNKEVLNNFIGSREVDNKANYKFPTLEKLKKIHPKASIKISSNNLSLHKNLVEQKLGVSVLPHFLIKEELKKKKFTDVLPKENLIFDLKIIGLKGDSIPAVSQKLSDYLSKLDLFV